MKIIHKEMREIEVIKDVLCNRCGKSCKVQGEYLELVELKVCWGYGSGKDGERHESHVCEECYDQIVAEFQIPPAIEGGFIDFGDFGWSEHAKTKEVS